MIFPYAQSQAWAFGLYFTKRLRLQDFSYSRENGIRTHLGKRVLPSRAVLRSSQAGLAICRFGDSNAKHPGLFCALEGMGYSRSES